MEPRQKPADLVNQMNELLQRVHFDARELQQYAPAAEGDTVPDQLHRIRILAMQLRELLMHAQLAS